MRPEGLSRLIVERHNAGDVDGMVALYEPEAVLALPDEQIATGSDEIRRAYEGLVVNQPTLFEPGTQRLVGRQMSAYDEACTAEVGDNLHATA